MPDLADALAALGEVCGRVLEQQAFIFAEPAAAGEGGHEPPALAAAVGFAGPARGRLRAAATAGFGQGLAANMLGADPGDERTGALAADAFKEALNIVLGNLLTTIYGESPVFRLTPPEPLPVPPAWSPDWEGPAVLRLRAEEGEVRLALDLEA